MLNYALYSQLHSLLLEISSLTSKLKLTSGSFYISSLDYLAKLQAFTDEHRLYLSSDIALATEKLLVFKGENLTVASLKHRNLRKEKDAYAVSCLDSIQKEIKIFLEKDRKAYEEGSDIWRQIVSRILIKQPEIKKINALERADTLISIAKMDPEISPYYAHVSGLLGIFNAKVILETILPQLGL